MSTRAYPCVHPGVCSSAMADPTARGTSRPRLSVRGHRPRKEPRLIAFNVYVDQDGSNATVVQVHPDADSMLFHMQVARDHISEAYQ
jgi:hypothetical protein